MTTYRPLPWLLPSLLSLDAPLVALAWLYIFAKTWRVDYHPWPSYLALGLTVWGIYATDRLLDASLSDSTEPLSPRHHAHLRGGRLLAVLIPLAFLGALATALFFLPFAVFGYAVVAGVLVLGFFATALFVGGRGDIPHAKNLLAGLAFSFGTATGAHVYLLTDDVFMLLRSPEMIAFALLCALNLTAGDLWRQAQGTRDPDARAGIELSLTLPLALLAGFALVFALRADTFTRPFYLAVLVSAAAMQIVNRMRHRIPGEALRAATDACLLAPWIYFLVA